MKQKIILLIFFFLFFSLAFVSAIEPMNLRTIKEIKSVNPSDVANLGFGVYQVSAQYNLGSYHQGKWMAFENKKCDDLKFGAVWVEFSWERPETEVILEDGAGNERKIYLPASSFKNSTYAEYYWIAEDGSSYYANSNHAPGLPDLTYQEAITSEHLARQSLSPTQINPEEEESLDCEFTGENTLKIKGKLIDQLTNEPIRYAELNGAYRFSPQRVITDEDGNFEFTVSSNFTSAYAFYVDCYGWSGNIVLQKNYELWENGQLRQEYNFALIKENFDSTPLIMDISGKKEIDIGKLYAYPSADISIQSDIDVSFNVMYKYKNSEGYNGGGNSNLKREHYLSNALPLDYEVYIQLKDETGKEYNSLVYRIPNNAKCKVVNLRYFNNESSWSVLFEVEPTEISGPMDIEISETLEEENPEIVSRLCLGCFKDNLCYPLGYRKNNEYCSENKTFISQLSSDNSCNNNFECSSNVCVSGRCIDEGFIQKIIDWFKKLFG